MIRALIVLPLVLLSNAARADLWAYVDEQGRSHVASHQVDARYKLFFKGETTLDVPNGPASERAQALEALAGTPLYRRATDTRVARRYEPLIETHARTHGLDPALVKAVVAVESAFDPRAVSPKGAVGLMQVIPATAQRYGVSADAKRTIEQKLMDPATNVRIGTRYLADLLRRFENDATLALAGYNAGEFAVERYDRRVPPYRETQAYVVLVQQFRDFYTPPPAPKPKPSRVVIPRRPATP